MRQGYLVILARIANCPEFAVQASNRCWFRPEEGRGAAALGARQVSGWVPV